MGADRGHDSGILAREAPHACDAQWPEEQVDYLSWLPLRDQCLICPWPHTVDRIGLAQAYRIRYVAHPGGPDVFGQAAWAEAR